jgi:hypothetical protein
MSRSNAEQRITRSRLNAGLEAALHEKNMDDIDQIGNQSCGNMQPPVAF